MRRCVYAHTRAHAHLNTSMRTPLTCVSVCIHSSTHKGIWADMWMHINVIKFWTHLCSLEMEWPITFVQVMGWFSFVDVSVDIPSSACLLKDINFYSRLLIYVLAPVGILIVIALPTCWARLRRYRTENALLSIFINTAFWFLFVIFPTVSSSWNLFLRAFYRSNALVEPDPFSEWLSYYHIDERFLERFLTPWVVMTWKRTGSGLLWCANVCYARFFGDRDDEFLLS